MAPTKRTATRTTTRKKAEPKPKTEARPRKPAKERAKGGRATAAKAAAPRSETLERAMELGRLALEKKALDVVVLDVRDLLSYADALVLMTAESDPQMAAIADFLVEKMKEKGERPIGTEGMHAGRWLLIDFGDIIAHVFYQDTRAFYDLEGLWADARRFEIHD